MDELIIKEDDMRHEIEDLINKSQLPAFILEPIFKEAYEQLLSLKVQQLNTAKENTNKKEVKKEKGEK